MHAHAVADAAASAVSLPRLAGPMVGPSTRSLRSRAFTLVREAASTIGAGLDGLLVGLVLGYVAAVFVSGPGAYLGVPPFLESVLTAVGAIGVAVLGASVGRLARGLLRSVGEAVDRLLARVAERARGIGRVRRVLAIPFRLVAGLPAGWLGAFAALLILANVADAGPLGLFIPAGALGAYVVLAGLIVAFGFAARRAAGPGLAGADRRAWPALGWRRRAVVALLAGIALVGSGSGAIVLFSSGSTAALVPALPDLDGIGVAPATLDDPGAPGTYAVRAVSYGSGTDGRRAAFGRDALVTTPTVDASAILDRLGWGADEARRWFWGFDTDALPLDGLVWLPEGDGPFPLVLMVHGNHAMGDFSSPGYAYLGEHLASRGFVAVSVDEDFLNGSWAGDWGGREQLARAWFLLLHLDQWRTWNADPASPFHGLVDMDRVALIGHSRGGEAASVAASLAERPTAPLGGMRPWPVGLRINAVAAIAPSDGQYAGGTVVLRDTDFLTIQGGHDGDATSWMGIRQYARTTIEDGGFKAALWSYRSNHGQFNTEWGRSDHGPLGGALLNLAPILDPEAQRDVARTAIGAFLEASLHDRVAYRDLFRRPMVGREWLPADDIYLVRSSDDAFVPLTTGNPASGLKGTTVTATGFDGSRSTSLPLRSILPDQGTWGVELRWAAGPSTASWEVGGIGPMVGQDDPAAIRLSLANGSLAPTDDASATARVDAAPLDLQVELVSTDGVSVSLPLSRWGALPPPLRVQLAKSELLASLSMMDLALDAPVERVLQTYELPLADFVAADPAFDPARLAAIRLVVDRSSAGALWVSEVGFVDGR